MPTELYLAYLATLCVFFLSPPGPSQLLMMSNGMAFGLRRSWTTIPGDLLANIAQMIVATFGIASLVKLYPTSMIALQLLGAAYLMYRAVMMFRVATQEAEEAVDTRNMFFFRQGFVTSATNPKAIIFFASLFPQFLVPEHPIEPQLVALGATYVMFDAILLVVYGLLGSQISAWLLGQRKRLVTKLSALTLAIVAGMLAIKAIR